jgi:DNA-binding CsgD family transcriptional regulator
MEGTGHIAFTSFLLEAVPMKSKHTAALTQIRQACCLGLPSRSFMPMVVAQLREMIPSVCGQFAWSSETGRITNFWSDTFMPRRLAWIVLHHKRYDEDSGNSFRDIVLFGSLTGNGKRMWGHGFEHSATYAAVFKPYGYKWMLDGVVRDGQRPYGCFALIRRDTDPDFTPDEEALLAQALPYVAHAMKVEATRPSRFVSSGRSALVICREDGQVLEWSSRAHELAVYALLGDLNLDARISHTGQSHAGKGRADFADVQPALGALVGELRARLQQHDGVDMPALVRRNDWGEFVFRAYPLDAARGDTSGRIGVLIEQCVPIEAHLLARVNDTGLSNRQKEVALLSARGLPNAQIARQLNLTPQTVKDYFKEIYARLQINSHQELLQRLS